MAVHAPQPLLISHHWSNHELSIAASRVQRWLLGFRARRQLQKLRKGERRRQKCIEELLDVHARFVRQLQVLSDLWRRRIAELTHVSGTSGDERLVNSIFPSLDAIVSMSTALSRALSEAHRGTHPLLATPVDAERKSIGSVFLTYAESFKVFQARAANFEPVACSRRDARQNPSHAAGGRRPGLLRRMGCAKLRWSHTWVPVVASQEYCNNMEAAGHRVAALNKMDAFRRVFSECQASPEAKGSDIMNWISRHNQHLMRQPLILDALAQLTPREHPDRAGLDAALEKLQVVVAQVDSRKLMHEQKVKLVQLQAQLRGDFDELVLPHRQLLREGALVDVTATRAPEAIHADSSLPGRLEPLGAICSALSGGAGSSCYAFLTNDSLWHC